MGIQYRVRHLFISIGVIFTLLFTQGIGANGDVEFHEAASIVMMNSLKSQPKNSFLKQLYTRLFYVPVWIDEDSLSSFSKELLKQITDDRTLERSSKLYQDAIAFLKAGYPCVEVYGNGNEFTVRKA